MSSSRGSSSTSPTTESGIFDLVPDEEGNLVVFQKNDSLKLKEMYRLSLDVPDPLPQGRLFSKSEHDAMQIHSLQSNVSYYAQSKHGRRFICQVTTPDYLKKNRPDLYYKLVEIKKLWSHKDHVEKMAKVFKKKDPPYIIGISKMPGPLAVKRVQLTDCIREEGKWNGAEEMRDLIELVSGIQEMCYQEPEELKRAREKAQLISAAMRPWTEKNPHHSSVQYNIARIDQLLSEALGVSGGFHTDSTDHKAYLTHLVDLSNLPDEVCPGHLWIGGYRILIRMIPGSIISFDSRKVHANLGFGVHTVDVNSPFRMAPVPRGILPELHPDDHPYHRITIPVYTKEFIIEPILKYFNVEIYGKVMKNFFGSEARMMQWLMIVYIRDEPSVIARLNKEPMDEEADITGAGPSRLLEAGQQYQEPEQPKATAAEQKLYHDLQYSKSKIRKLRSKAKKKTPQYETYLKRHEAWNAAAELIPRTQDIDHFLKLFPVDEEVARNEMLPSSRVIATNMIAALKDLNNPVWDHFLELAESLHCGDLSKKGVPIKWTHKGNDFQPLYPEADHIPGNPEWLNDGTVSLKEEARLSAERRAELDGVEASAKQNSTNEPQKVAKPKKVARESKRKQISKAKSKLSISVATEAEPGSRVVRDEPGLEPECGHKRQYEEDELELLDLGNFHGGKHDMEWIPNHISPVGTSSRILRPRLNRDLHL